MYLCVPIQGPVCALEMFIFYMVWMNKIHYIKIENDSVIRYQNKVQYIIIIFWNYIVDC